jgi:hypothetical protein
MNRFLICAFAALAPLSLTSTAAQADTGKHDYLIGVHAPDPGNDACFAEATSDTTIAVAKNNCIAARKIEAAATALADGNQCVIHTHGVLRGYFLTGTEGEYLFQVKGRGPSVNATRIRRATATVNPNCPRPVYS